MKSGLIKKAAALGTVLVMTAMTAMPASAAQISKDETVYVVTGSNGSQQEVVVSDHLKNSLESDKIHDASNLENIENVKGEETFEKGAKDSLVWNAGGKDIFYQGTTAQETPVTMKISYTLDGKSIEGKDLDGATGRLKIQIDYTNNAKADVNGKSVTVPFIAMTGFIVEDETLTDIDIDHGKVIDDGDKKIVVGMAAPGLQEALDLNVKNDKIDVDLDLNDSVTITGNAKEFSVQDMMTVVTNSAFDEIDADEFDKLDMDDQVKQLQDGAKKLADGSDTLYQGIDTLNENMPELQKGAAALKKGADSLQAGTNKALDGSRQISDGAVKLRGTLKKKMNQIADACSEMKSGTGTILSGLKEIKNGLDKKGEKPEEMGVIQGLDTVAQGLRDGSDSAKKGAYSLQQAAEGIAGARVKLKKGSEDVTNNLKAIDSIMPSDSGSTPSDEDVNKALEGVDPAKAAEIRNIINAYKSAAGTAGTYKAAAEKYKQVAQGAGQGLEDAYTGLSAVQIINDETGKPDPSKGIALASKSMEQSANDLSNAAKAIDTINGGLKKISGSLGSYDQDLAKEGKKQTTLIGGLTSINAGLASLHDQVAKSVGKEGELSKGLDQLVSGTDQMKKGNVQLAGGAKQLADGMEDLKEGTDSLAGGTKKLDKGAKQLRDGMSKLYKDGIKELVDLYQNDLKGSIKNVEDLADAGQSYKTFTRLADGMDGSVKFIYKTTFF